MDTKDETLLKGCLKGDRKSQNALYKKYERRMYAICLRYATDREEALDILQEGFIRIFKGLHQYRGEGSLVKWMDRVVANAAIRYISKRKKIFFQEDADLERILKGSDSVNEASDAKDVMSLIQLLPLGYRTVFNMFAIEGYSHKEIAEKLGITEGGSRSQYSRAKKAMQNILRQNEMI